VLLRHWQPSFFGFEWCIGHSAAPVWGHVHVTESAAWDITEASDSGAAVRMDTWQQSQAQTIHGSRRRNVASTSRL
jgi:hypothetical protein